MFREMRLKDRELSSEDAMEILTNGEYGILATVGENGYPYAAPLNYIYINDRIYIHCAVAGHKLDNITYNDKVSFCVVNSYLKDEEHISSYYKSAVVFGKASIVENEEKMNALLKLGERFFPSKSVECKQMSEKLFDRVCVIKIDIEHITGKAQEEN